MTMSKLSVRAGESENGWIEVEEARRWGAGQVMTHPRARPKVTKSLVISER